MSCRNGTTKISTKQPEYWQNNFDINEEPKCKRIKVEDIDEESEYERITIEHIKEEPVYHEKIKFETIKKEHESCHNSSDIISHAKVSFREEQCCCRIY